MKESKYTAKYGGVKHTHSVENSNSATNIRSMNENVRELENELRRRHECSEKI